MDIRETLKAKSDQLNADDLMGGPIVAQITDATPGAKDQPVNVHLSGGHCPWRPCKGMRRILARLWGTETDAWIGQWVELYRNDSVRWAGELVGGIELSAMSGIESPVVEMQLTVSRGKKKAVTIRRLDAPTQQGKPTANLHKLLESEGVSVATLDAWRMKSGKGPIGDLSDDEQAAFAGWLAGRPDTLRELREARK